MGFIDPHIHTIFLGFEELREMTDSGYETVVTLAFMPVQPRAPESLADHFEQLFAEQERGKRIGLQVLVGVALHPRNVPQKNIDKYLSIVEEYIEQAHVIGEAGLENATEHEVEALRKQIRLAKEYDKPIIIHTPRSNKFAVTKRISEIIEQEGISGDLVIIDHLSPNPRIIDRVRDLNTYLGFTIQPGKSSIHDILYISSEYPDLTDRIIINSDSGRDAYTPLAVKKAYELLETEAGFKRAYQFVCLNARKILRI